MEDFIKELKVLWKPEMKTLEGKAYEGPIQGDEPFDVLYWDVANAKWTHRSAAFKSYVFATISKFI